MSQTYQSGTVSVSQGSNTVTGTDTYFKTIGLVQANSLITFDGGNKYYRIYEVVDDSTLLIRTLISEQPFEEADLSDATYTIEKSFARQTNAGLASDFVNFQFQLLQQKFEFYNWVNATEDRYAIDDGNGGQRNIFTPVGLENLFADIADGEIGGGYGDIYWSAILNKPMSFTPSQHGHTWIEVTDKPETATRWPEFQEVTGTVSDEQLPESVTQDKKSLAISPRINREQSLTQRLTDYPTLTKTEVRPTESPNNKRMIQFDDVRGEVHVALTDSWFTITTTIASRAFPIFYRGLILRFNNNNAYSGNIKMRVYPMGNGGLGLPNNPTLANHQWYEYETTILEEDPLYKIGEFNSQYFEGIIEYIELDTGWHQFDVNQSNVGSLNAKFDVAFGTLRSPFRTFYQKADGYWYSEDMFPDTLDEIGPSWAQDTNNPRVFTVTEADGSTDALRFFGDGFDDFQFEIILDVSNLRGSIAVTVSNANPNRIYFSGPSRFIADERIYLKRTNPNSPISATILVESLKMRIPHYG
ncbi:hypothetical protein [Alteromonas mediterranea]|uniref:Uncharacterized protein n=1 Tax=Alteromonas mediterranea (strain DSM 17117 / CIP 110805 / LMG 28347 / Deep ecotype) TaxID=1774373 RepID=F2GC86_ALTMD|nr:hypothetical protein [Alteromonas mediterranea]AEA99042.2 hypothetical protein MADE_1014540 [Alteromonas mediterranea DE]